MKDEKPPVAGTVVRRAVKRVALVAAMAVVTLNIWTGAPLIALWVGISVNSYLTEQGLQSIQFGDVSWPLIGAAILGTSLLAMIAGAVPALQAARLAPKEAVAAA